MAVGAENYRNHKNPKNHPDYARRSFGAGSSDNTQTRVNGDNHQEIRLPNPCGTPWNYLG